MFKDPAEVEVFLEEVHDQRSQLKQEEHKFMEALEERDRQIEGLKAKLSK